MANSTSPSLRLTVLLVLSFLLMLLFTRPQVFTAAEDQFSGSPDVGGGGGGDNFPSAEKDVGSSDERSELCNTDTSTFLPPPYNNLTDVICTPVWNTFLLRYQKREGNVVTFIVSAVYTAGWVGMGFSKDGMMVGSSAMVGWLNKKGHAKIKQYFLQGRRSSQVIADAGELDLTKVPPAVVIHGAMIHLAFQARFQNPFNQQPILLAFGTRFPNHYSLSKHDDKTTILFDFSAGSASTVQTSTGMMKTNHGIMGIMAWGLLLPVGAILARYLRHKDPLWYYLHAGFQFVGFLFGLTTVILGQRLYNKIHAQIPAHRGIGYFVLTLSILQILAFFLRPNKEAKIRRYWNWYHGWFGRIALFFGALNVVLGMHAGNAGISWKIVFGFQISIILVAVIVLETLSWIKRSEKDTLPIDANFQMNPIQ